MVSNTTFEEDEEDDDDGVTFNGLEGWVQAPGT